MVHEHKPSALNIGEKHTNDVRLIISIKNKRII